LGSLASPTDPTATLAVKTEFNAKGRVMDTIMGIAAFDDVFGIINYSIAVAIASALLNHQSFSVGVLSLPLYSILGAIVLGSIFGILLNCLTRLFKKEKEGALLVIISGVLLVSFGTASLIKVDELLTTMSVGIIVVNFNPKQKEIFKVIERYTDEIIFTLFFTISGLKLNLSSLNANYFYFLIYILFRFAGKYTGIYVGGLLSNTPRRIRKYTIGGLIPQGGIVIGLALMMSGKSAFAPFSDLLISIVLGATVIHELIGPVVAKISLKKAGEIRPDELPPFKIGPWTKKRMNQSREGEI
jgi:Kef-type K+ transport system membrane component KefB